MPCRKSTIGDHLILPSHQCIYCNGITMVGYNSQYRTISRKYFSNSVDFGLYVVLGQVDWLPCYCITSSEYAWRWILGKFYNYYCGTDCTYRVYCNSLCMIVLQGRRMMIFVLTSPDPQEPFWVSCVYLTSLWCQDNLCVCLTSDKLSPVWEATLYILYYSIIQFQPANITNYPNLS